MNNLETISLLARASGPDLYLRIRFDGQEIFADYLPTVTQEISHEFDDNTEVSHCLEIEMSGKTQQHTRLDSSGKIVEDRCIEISDITLGGINLGYTITQVAVYEHDTNGTTEKLQEKFFGTMGCNGVVRLEFSSPLYLWLLEKM